jgi:hypothetical protein
VIQNPPKKVHDEYFFVPVLDHLVSVSAGLVPEPALCPGAGAAERSQETLYVLNVNSEFALIFIKPFIKNNYKYFRFFKDNHNQDTKELRHYKGFRSIL